MQRWKSEQPGMIKVWSHQNINLLVAVTTTYLESIFAGNLGALCICFHTFGRVRFMGVKTEICMCRCIDCSISTCSLSLSFALEGHSPDKDFAHANLGWQPMSSRMFFLGPDYHQSCPCKWQGDLKGYHFLLKYVRV